jgi:hypothetical protein
METPEMNVRRATPLTLPLVALTLALLNTVPASAATFCVSTGTQLANALNTAASNGQNDVIRIEARTLSGTSNPVSNPRWQYLVQPSDADSDLTISGGWSTGNNCATQVSTSPTDTALDAAFTGRALNFGLESGFDFTGNVEVRNLTITRASSNVSSIGAAFNWSITGGTTSSLLVENMLVVATNATGGSAAVVISHGGSGSAKARNLIVYGNTSAGVSPVFISASGSAFAILSNASIFDNTNSAAGSGLTAQGTVTLSNNAVADNVSSAATSFQAYSPLAGSLTLRNNHFGTRSFTGGASSEIGTTTGNAQWSQVGSIIVPDANSPLRDSGTNSPLGGLAPTDFDGNARIVNGTVDRGAIEAAPVPAVGPSVVPASPLSNSTSTLPNGVAGDNVFQSLSFSVSGGTNGGTTQLLCTATAGTVTSILFGNQTIQIGASVTPVRVNFTLSAAPQTGTVQCTATPQGGVAATYTYFFNVPAGTVLGPIISALVPQEGSTTTLTPTAVDELVYATITFLAEGGFVNGISTINCFDLSGPLTISQNAMQSVNTASQPLPVQVAFVATATQQQGMVRCQAKRHPTAPAVSMDYTYIVAPASDLFRDGFE